MEEGMKLTLHKNDKWSEAGIMENKRSLYVQFIVNTDVVYENVE